MNFLTPREASKYLAETRGIRRAPQTLAKYRVIGGGPLFRKAGASVLYEKTELLAWADELMSPARASTSEAR